MSDSHEQAALWHARLTDHPATGIEADFQWWLAASPENRVAYHDVVTAQRDLAAAAEQPQILALRQQTLARLAVQERSRNKGRAMLGMTVALLMVGGPLYLVIRSEPPAGPAEPTASRQASEEGWVYTTGVGQRSSLTMGDGSRVTLNTASRLRASYSTGERRLTLEQGQAWFEVAKGDPRPFIVLAGGQRLEARGTAFDIRLRPGRTEVMLAEGRVTVAREDASGSGQVSMRPKELLIASDAGVTVRPVADVLRWSIWRQGKVIFDDIPLTEAVSEMNRYHEVQLEVRDAQTSGIRVSGVFNAGATQAFLETLAKAFNVQAQSDGSGRLILRQVQPPGAVEHSKAESAS